MPTKNRYKRRHAATQDDQRNPFQRDRDRILYSSAFRRLDGVTQIVRAGEADIFHNRLTHSIKVAQVGRRLAEHCIRQDAKAADFHGLDPEIVEAAALGHDLGHPPFGHIGEETLDELLTAPHQSGGPLDPEGFEGNAQSFRIVAKLAVRFSNCDGLDLTGGTLAALLKYPWARVPGDENRGGKWGFYRSEEKDFDFCREGVTDDTRSLEAELMDWADDIAYSVHDLEDFHRCNAIPWLRIIGEGAADIEDVVQNTVARWHGAPSDAQGRLREAHRRLSTVFERFGSSILAGAYEGRREQRRAIRALTSFLIGRYIRGTKVVSESAYDPDRDRLDLDEYHQDEVRLLKQVARDYILRSPSLAAQQSGQKRILQALFHDFHGEICAGTPRALPRRFHHLLDEGDDNGLRPARIACDCVASLTEGEAIALHQRLTGFAAGSVLDPIVR